MIISLNHMLLFAYQSFNNESDSILGISQSSLWDYKATYHFLFPILIKLQEN